MSNLTLISVLISIHKGQYIEHQSKDNDKAFIDLYRKGYITIDGIVLTKGRHLLFNVSDLIQ